MDFVKIESEKIKNHQKLKRNFESILSNHEAGPRKLLEDFTVADIINLNLLLSRHTPYQLYCHRLDLSKYNNYYHYYKLVYIFPFFNIIQKFQLSEQKE